MPKHNDVHLSSEIIFYHTDDGRNRISVRLEYGTVWLTQTQIIELFQSSKQNVSLHIRNIYAEGELSEAATVKEYLTVQTEGSRQVQRRVKHYNLDVIIAVGYRVKSLRGTQFRVWATETLREYLVKGFALDDDRLKHGTTPARYFDELLARIRDIRSSEKVFWRKVLDIYATSIDYDPKADVSRAFFRTIQNKMHWAVHGHTAAEVLAQRANATLPHMGLTSWAGDTPRRADAEVAKNYLNEDEIIALNRIVTAYLEFAELQALNRKPMHMRDWITQLEGFLRLSGREILTHGGTITHEEALEKARAECDKYHAAHLDDLSAVEKHFLEMQHEAKEIEQQRPERAEHEE